MDSDSLSEKELLNTCIQGNKEAWDAFVEKYTNLIYHTINKTLKTYHADSLYQDINDIHNNVFLSLMENDYKKLRQYEGRNGCTVSSWLMVVTTNFALNIIKRQKSYIPIDDATGDSMGVIEKISNPQPQPEEELTPEEIAKMLNLTVNAIYSKKNRIREKLKKIAKKKNILQDN